MQALFKHGRLIMYRNQAIIRQSSPDDGFFVVVAGLVRVNYHCAGQEAQEYFLGTGDDLPSCARAAQWYRASSEDCPALLAHDCPSSE